ncbi:3-oxoacid CoA-transferase subunit B [Variovorax sp. N23]|uniref:3-oxoacid CoA-transferase subunit B n=1 Tax=Variovorax sp. N23 TaxID=2980555 RepID=UPI0021C9A2CB|nr:3-oxoacid CoA-transferase subunit B [Variovorax sp. N23]MCU4119105.1 3-oxoacid CoA-transferase subunit B [Variovorax sp. N23]
MADLKKLSRHRLAQIVAAEIPDGSYVNVGLGIPTLVARYLDPSKEVILHSENGILGLRGLREGEAGDVDLINASKEHVQLVPGSSICEQSTSFAMMRGGHLDATILGAFQVSPNGDIASWSTGDPNAVPGIGGAMDLVAGAKRVIVTMEHTTRDGQPKLLERCVFPLTGCGVVTSVYTDLVAIDVVPGTGFVVRGLADGVSREQVQRATGAPLHWADCVSVLTH